MNETANQLRQSAADHDREAYESFERCDTDGFVSQWAHGVNAQLDRLRADIADNNGKWTFEALFDLDGNLIPAREVETRYGWAWMLLDENDRCTGWFNASHAKNPETRRRNDAKKGVYVGTIKAPAYAKLSGSNACTVTAIVLPRPNPDPQDIVIVDNGQDDH
jgi:hypothetical protein